MIVIAMRSSTIARVSRNTRSAGGRKRPTTAITATAKAMSVAVGIAQPDAASASPAVKSRKISAGATTPPAAAAMGSAAARGSRRRPATNSSFSSSPTTKKKIASRPSAAHAPTDSSRCSSGMPNVKSRIAAYQPDAGLLARIRAATVAARSSTPAVTSLRTVERTPRHSSWGATRKMDDEDMDDLPHGGNGRHGHERTTHRGRRCVSCVAAGSPRSLHATACPRRWSIRWSPGAGRPSRRRPSGSPMPAGAERAPQRASDGEA